MKKQYHILIFCVALLVGFVIFSVTSSIPERLSLRSKVHNRFHNQRKHHIGSENNQEKIKEENRENNQEIIKEENRENNQLVLENSNSLEKYPAKIGFVKTHKTGSTTINTMLLRWCFFEHKKAYIGNDHYIKSKDHPHPADVIVQHHTYLPRDQLKKFYRDVVGSSGLMVSIFRDPGKRMLSVYHFFSVNAPPLPKWIQRKRKAKNGLFCMSRDLGLNLNLHSTDNLEEEAALAMKDLVDLPMIIEQFDESLIVLKEMLSLRYEDILYVRTNSCNHKRWDGLWVSCPTSKEKTPEMLHQLAELCPADPILYRMAKQKLAQLISKVDNFQQKLAHFRAMIAKLDGWCRPTIKKVKVSLHAHHLKSHIQNHNVQRTPVKDFSTWDQSDIDMFCPFLAILDLDFENYMRGNQ